MVWEVVSSPKKNSASLCSPVSRAPCDNLGWGQALAAALRHRDARIVALEARLAVAASAPKLRRPSLAPPPSPADPSAIARRRGSSTGWAEPRTELLAAMAAALSAAAAGLVFGGGGRCGLGPSGDARIRGG